MATTKQWHDTSGTVLWTVEKWLSGQGFACSVGSTRKVFLRSDGVEVHTCTSSVDKKPLKPGQVRLKLAGKWLYGKPEELYTHVPARCADDAAAVERLKLPVWG